MPTNFLIVHGTGANPTINWFPWMQQNLEQDGHRVLVPHFPSPEKQSFVNWLNVAENNLRSLDPASTILIGHSTGAVFVLRLAELASQPYKAVFSICPFMRDLGLDPYDRLNSTFVHHAFDWNRIKRNAAQISCFAGANDPYVPLSYTKEVADHAAATLTVIENGGHLNGECGYLEFPLLLDKIRQTEDI